MPDVKIALPSFGKDVLVAVPDGLDLAEAFNEASAFAQMLEANNKIRDREAGIDPPRATHEIVKEGKDSWRLQRFRF